MVTPFGIHLDACSFCQLRCPGCGTAEAGEFFGRGCLRLSDFRMLLDRNPWIRQVGFASKGEMFLNQELPDILRYAHWKNVAIDMYHGSNFNDVSAEALEAVVECQVERLCVSVDGATQATYQKYRLGGSLAQVINNIRKINALKEKLRSSRPRLCLQFIPFNHNVHEFDAAILLARMLHMEFRVQLNRWPESLSEDARNRLRLFLGYADRRECFQREGKNYRRRLCCELWRKPLIGWDGRLLGCVRNIWSAYAENVFEKDLMTCIRGERMQAARDMLMGKEPPRAEIPCVRCEVGCDLIESGGWLTESEIYGGERSATG